MNKAITLIAVAGFAGVSAAQVTPNLCFVADKTSALVGETITWTVIASWNGAAQDYIFGYDLDIQANDNTLGTASTFTTALSNAIGPTAGTAAGASINNVSGGQSSLIGGVLDFASPTTLGTFTVVAGALGSLSYSAVDGGVLGSTDGLNAKNGSDFGATVFNTLGQVKSDSVRIIVPTPASAALLGLGGLVATRRRR